jgi:hypothetical protein
MAKAGGNLSGENGQGKIPRADAGKNAMRVAVQRLCLTGVIAQKIHRFAQFTNAIA